MKNISTTLLFIVKNDKIMLAEKKRGFGIGMLNGVGGKLEQGESVEEGLLRETKEEINVKPVNYTQVAYIECDGYYKGEVSFEKMYVYIASDYEGELSESDEMKPMWFDLDKIPYSRMWEGDRLWIKYILENKKIKGYLKFNKDNKLLKHNFEIIENF